MSPAQLHAFPPAVGHGILESFVRSLHSVFLLGVPLAVVFLGLTLLLKESRLRTESALERPSGAGATPDAAVTAAPEPSPTPA